MSGVECIPNPFCFWVSNGKKRCFMVNNLLHEVAETPQVKTGVPFLPPVLSGKDFFRVLVCQFEPSLPLTGCNSA